MGVLEVVANIFILILFSRNLGLVLLTVTIVTLLLLGSLRLCLLVLVTVLLTLVDLIGFLHFWGITIDIISSISVILAVGFCVDYSCHIAHRFLLLLIVIKWQLFVFRVSFSTLALLDRGCR